jgi:ribA/ribD-fused uncharacterized protein
MEPADTRPQAAPPAGPITLFRGEYRFLSNFAPFPVLFDGVEYPTAEHAYVAAKTLDPEVRARVRTIDTPGNVKYRGKSIELRADWEAVRDDVMLAILRSKFTRNPKAGELLLATGVAELVEGNRWHDNYWGRCRCKHCKDASGRNTLGRLLMMVRAELRNDIAAPDTRPGG